MKKNIFWPEIDDLWSAKKACIQASSVAILVGIATGVITYLHLRGTEIITGVSGASFIDSAIFLILGFFIYRGSRIASVAGLIIYIAGQIMMIPQMQRPPISAIFFSLFLISGIRGSFAYQEMKKGLSREEIKTTLKAQREETDPHPSLKKRIIAWVILIALAGGGYWFYRKASRHPDSHAVIQDMSPAPVFKTSSSAASVLKNAQAFWTRISTAKAEPQKRPSSAEPLPGEKIFKLKNGQTLTGRVIADDPVYYTVETSGGRQEIVIKEDIAE